MFSIQTFPGPRKGCQNKILMSASSTNPGQTVIWVLKENNLALNQKFIQQTMADLLTNIRNACFIVIMVVSLQKLGHPPRVSHPDKLSTQAEETF